LTTFYAKKSSQLTEAEHVESVTEEEERQQQQQRQQEILCYLQRKLDLTTDEIKRVKISHINNYLASGVFNREPDEMGETMDFLKKRLKLDKIGLKRIILYNLSKIVDGSGGYSGFQNLTLRGLA
jgi:hypothetical protein